MIIKKYVVKQLSEAQEIIDKELGTNGVILTSRTIRAKGFRAWFGTPNIEVTAAIEEEELIAHQKFMGIINSGEDQKKNTNLTTNNLQDNLSSVKQLLGNLTNHDIPKKQNSKKRLLQASQGLLQHFSDNSNELTDEAHASKIQKSALLNFLQSKGIALSISTMLISNVMKRLGINEIPQGAEKRTEIYNVLKREIAATIKTSGPLTLKQGRPKLCAVVGPTGVGKTTTIIKIALQYAQELKKKVALITLDTAMVGAYEYIHAIAQNFGLPLAKAGTLEELHAAIRLYDESDLILIDTSGRCQYQSQKVNELGEILNTLEGLEIHLALSATTKDIDIIGAIAQFEDLNIESLIFTKLDETIAHGVLVNACIKTGKSISYVTNGQQIPGDLLIANSDEIARSILVQNNAEEFDHLRQLASK